jgi:hypothetical protein
LIGFSKEAVPKLQFRNSSLEFIKKAGWPTVELNRFFGSLFHRKRSLRTNRVLKQALKPEILKEPRYSCMQEWTCSTTRLAEVVQ